MFLVGSEGAFRAQQEHVLLELRAHQTHVLLELRIQQTAHFEPKVVILAIFIIITVKKVNLLNLKYYIHNFSLSFRRKIFHVKIPLRDSYMSKCFFLTLNTCPMNKYVSEGLNLKLNV